MVERILESFSKHWLVRLSLSLLLFPSLLLPLLAGKEEEVLTSIIHVGPVVGVVATFELP